MAITASGWYYTTVRDTFIQAIALDLGAETHKIALFTNTITPNFSTDTAYGATPYNANEIANGGGYTTGGQLIANTTVTNSPSTTLMWDATDAAWTSSTITNASGGLAYADALTGNNAILLISFGSPYSTSSGTFTIQYPTTGIGTVQVS